MAVWGALAGTLFGAGLDFLGGRSKDKARDRALAQYGDLPYRDIADMEAARLRELFRNPRRSRDYIEADRMISDDAARSFGATMRAIAPSVAMQTGVETGAFAGAMGQVTADAAATFADAKRRALLDLLTGRSSRLRSLRDVEASVLGSRLNAAMGAADKKSSFFDSLVKGGVGGAVGKLFG